MDALLHELEDCIPASQTVQQALDERELATLLENWLYTLSQEDRRLFLQRYWYGVPLQELAAAQGVAPNKLTGRMYRLRKALQSTLEKEGILL